MSHTLIAPVTTGRVMAYLKSLEGWHGDGNAPVPYATVNDAAQYAIYQTARRIVEAYDRGQYDYVDTQSDVRVVFAMPPGVAHGVICLYAVN